MLHFGIGRVATVEHFSAKWIRFAVRKCGTRKKRAGSMKMETALVWNRLGLPGATQSRMGI
jgi:hypothetical protein